MSFRRLMATAVAAGLAVTGLAFSSAPAQADNLTDSVTITSNTNHKARAQITRSPNLGTTKSNLVLDVAVPTLHFTLATPLPAENTFQVFLDGSSVSTLKVPAGATTITATFPKPSLGMHEFAWGFDDEELVSIADVDVIETPKIISYDAGKPKIPGQVTIKLKVNKSTTYVVWAYGEKDQELGYKPVDAVNGVVTITYMHTSASGAFFALPAHDARVYNEDSFFIYQPAAAATKPVAPSKPVVKPAKPVKAPLKTQPKAAIKQPVKARPLADTGATR